ncbi:hypothetical protein DUI70_4225 [Streptomyces albus]|nr:hypothetical protein DUI70_4225 [Streptomyces albus]
MALVLVPALLLALLVLTLLLAPLVPIGALVERVPLAVGAVARVHLVRTGAVALLTAGAVPRGGLLRGGGLGAPGVAGGGGRRGLRAPGLTPGLAARGGSALGAGGHRALGGGAGEQRLAPVGGQHDAFVCVPLRGEGRVLALSALRHRDS